MAPVGSPLCILTMLAGVLASTAASALVFVRRDAQGADVFGYSRAATEVLTAAEAQKRGLGELVFGRSTRLTD